MKAAQIHTLYLSFKYNCFRLSNLLLNFSRLPIFTTPILPKFPNSLTRLYGTPVSAGSK